MDEGDAYRELRPLLFSIAYRMVGSVSEAEDLVREAFLRFHRAVSGGEEVASAKAWLSAVTTRLAIDHLRSARARRERYVGAWLPEPLVTSKEPDAADHAETADSLSLAFLVVLERLSPVQRAVFLLHDVFGYGYGEIAELVGKSEDNCRQIAARARRHVEAGRPVRGLPAPAGGAGPAVPGRGRAGRHRGPGGAAGRRRGPVRRRRRQGPGPRRPPPRRPAGGPVPARPDPPGAAAGIRLRPAEVNGQPGLLSYDPEGRLLGVLALDIADGRVQTVRSIVNPDKLRHLGPVGDLSALFDNG
jgi:RNA polymerase sigma-70 factor, ECF subfamily